MFVTRDKNCYCHTCKKDFHYLGIANNRLGHRNRREKVTITFTHGDTKTWDYSKRKANAKRSIYSDADIKAALKQSGGSERGAANLLPRMPQAIL